MIAPIDQDAAIRAITIESKLREPLYDSLGVDLRKLKTSIASEIARGISMGQSYDRIARNISLLTKAPLSRAKTIVRTEAGRVQEQAAYAAGQKAIAAGANVVKQWSAVLDGKTREDHRRLDHQVREMDEDFEVNGQKAQYPHGFDDPKQDCNCRCTLLVISRSMMDEGELKRMQERAEFFGLDKTKDFEEFREKYLKAAESVENAGKSGIIQVKKFSIRDAVSSGTVTTKINAEKQGRHIKTSKAYIEGRSYLNGTLEDAQRLVDDLSGTGEAVIDENGNWLHKERVQADHVFGIHVDLGTGKETETSKGMIIYSKTGTHIIPRKEDNE